METSPLLRAGRELGVQGTPAKLSDQALTSPLLSSSHLSDRGKSDSLRLASLLVRVFGLPRALPRIVAFEAGMM